MRRLFWLALGASAGVLLSRSLRNQAEQLKANLTPGTLLAGVADSVTGFLDELRDGMREREDQLRTELGLDEQP